MKINREFWSNKGATSSKTPRVVAGTTSSSNREDQRDRAKATARFGAIAINLPSFQQRSVTTGVDARRTRGDKDRVTSIEENPNANASGGTASGNCRTNGATITGGFTRAIGIDRNAIGFACKASCIRISARQVIRTTAITNLTTRINTA